MKPEKINAKGHKDERGEIYSISGGPHNPLFEAEREHELVFHHTKVTTSKKNVFRGFHSDEKTWKKITCVHGSIVSVMINPENTEYLEEEVSPENKKVILVPPNWYNGFISVTNSIYVYCMSYDGNYNDVEKQRTLRLQDSCYGENNARKWICSEALILSNRDK